MSKREKLPLAALSLRFLRDDRGVTSIEYAMIASGVAVAIAATLVTVGSSVTNMYTTVLTAMK
ncbi:MAG TPA: Flp family type IVb pilin [Xanthobacteraceae bacterium]|jgi:pilus assembly protein Flp/PilA|nr:Flp family type IVb pilin [Xanthobacteraceae bacterium]